MHGLGDRLLARPAGQFQPAGSVHRGIDPVESRLVGSFQDAIGRWAIEGADKLVGSGKSCETGGKILIALLACAADREGGPGDFAGEAGETLAALVRIR